MLGRSAGGVGVLDADPLLLHVPTRCHPLLRSLGNHSLAMLPDQPGREKAPRAFWRDTSSKIRLVFFVGGGGAGAAGPFFLIGTFGIGG